MEKIIDNLENDKKIIVLTYNFDNENDKSKEIRTYDNLKRTYSFKSNLTLIKVSNDDLKLNTIRIKMFLILLRSANRQKVDIIYMPQTFKKIFDIYELKEYEGIAKYYNDIN